MGIFKWLKKGLGIGGVKSQLVLDQKEFPLDCNKISGKINLSSKGNDMKITDRKVYVEQKIDTKIGEESTTQNIRLGEFSTKEEFVMNEGDTKTLDFSVEIDLTKASDIKPGTSTVHQEIPKKIKVHSNDFGVEKWLGGWANAGFAEVKKETPAAVAAVAGTQKISVQKTTTVSYRIRVHIDVKDVAFDPGDAVEIKFL